MKRVFLSASKTALCVAGIVSGQLALAADVVTTRAAQEPARAWTDAEFASARSAMPKVNFLPAAVFDYNASVAEANGSVSAINVAGSVGGADARNLREERPSSLVSIQGVEAESAFEPQAVGTGARHFTSTRTYPNNSDTTYPTRTVGKLYFRDAETNINYVCSGSMIKKGVVLTSGHCIHTGSNRFYTLRFPTWVEEPRLSVWHVVELGPGTNHSGLGHGRWRCAQHGRLGNHRVRTQRRRSAHRQLHRVAGVPVGHLQRQTPDDARLPGEP